MINLYQKYRKIDKKLTEKIIEGLILVSINSRITTNGTFLQKIYYSQMMCLTEHISSKIIIFKHCNTFIGTFLHELSSY